MRKLGSSICEFTLQTVLGSIVNLIVNTEWIFSHIGSSSDERIFCTMFSYISVIGSEGIHSYPLMRIGE